MADTLRRWAGWNGIIGPLLFSAVVIIGASSRSEYSHVSDFISGLGATGTPNAGLMNLAGFVLSGLLILLVAIALFSSVSGSTFARIAAVLVMFFPVGMISAGIFSCDAGCPPEGSTENTIHQLVSVPAFIGGIAGIALSGIAFRKMPAFKGLWLYSVISGIIAGAFLVRLISSIGGPSPTGLWQRLMIFTIFLWIAVVGIHLMRQREAT